MEDNKNDTAVATPPNQGGVMDIAPPTRSIPVTDDTDSGDTDSSVEAAVEAPVEQPPATESAPAPEPEMVPEPPKEEMPTAEASNTAAKGEDTKPPDNPLAISKPPAKKNGAPKAAIIVAVIIALALVGVTVFGYLKSKNQSRKTTTSNAPTAAIPEKVTASDVDQASKSLDATLSKVDESKDFSSNDLTDKTLGL